MRSAEDKLVDGFAAAELECFVSGDVEIAANLLLVLLADQRTHPRAAVARVADLDLPIHHARHRAELLLQLEQSSRN